MDQQAIALIGQLLVHADQSLGGGTLQKGFGRLVERRAQEVVGRRVADVELDRIIKLHQLHKIRFGERAALRRRRGGERFAADFGDGATRLDPKGAAVLAVEMATLEDHVGRLHLRGLAGLVAREDQFLAMI